VTAVNGGNVKFTQLGAVVILVLAHPSFAKEKAYSHTGRIVTTSFQSDYSVHTETSDGHSYDTQCNTTSNSVDCAEGTGIYRRLALDDGSTVPLVRPVSTFTFRLEDMGHDDPLGDLANSSRPKQDSSDPKTFHYPDKSFQYRTVRLSSGFDGIIGSALDV
jgi:hypothetical protein